jgi:hypothetical protein
MRHRRGTPGLTPYRLRTIEAGHPRRRRPARHLRRGAASRFLPRTTAAKPTQKRAIIQRRLAGSQVALGVAGAITLALLIVGGYQAATGAAVVLGMF